MLFFKLLGESVLFALHALVVNKLRTILSLLGITIGIFAIIAVFTGVDALEDNVKSSIAKLGSNVIYIQKWPWTFGPNYPWWKYMNRPVPDLKDVNGIVRRCRAAEAVAFQASVKQTVKYRSNIVERVDVIAISAGMDRIHSFEFENGRYFSDVESAAGRNVIVLGALLAEGLFGANDPIGRQVTLFGRKLKVVGVLRKEGESMFDTGMDNDAAIPVNYARNVMDIKTDRADPLIMVKGREGIPNSELISELRGVMRSLRMLRPAEEDDFALNEASLITKGFESIFDVFGFAAIFIGGFSILIGGFGIANIMFVSVKERTSIIGIQKALGAKRYFILIQFLAESVTLCVVGGIVGLLLVYLGSLVVGALTDFSLPLTFRNIFIGISVSAGLGVLFGFIPAWNAARLDPVEAIRS